MSVPYVTISKAELIAKKAAESAGKTYTAGEGIIIDGTQIKVDTSFVATAEALSTLSGTVSQHGTQIGQIEQSIDSHGSAILSLQSAVAGKLDDSLCTLTTTAPTAAIEDGGVHLVYLTAEPETYYDGYFYFIKES